MRLFKRKPTVAPKADETEPKGVGDLDQSDLNIVKGGHARLGTTGKVVQVLEIDPDTLLEVKETPS